MKSISLLLSSLLVLALSIAQAQPSAYAKYTPSFLKDVPFETMRSDFEKLRPNAGKPSGIMGFRHEYAEKTKGKTKLITYYFMGNGVDKLYEYIIDFKKKGANEKEAVKLLGPPNNNGEWLLKADNGITVKAWTFSNSLVIAAVLPGSEWDESK
ncbi:MAG: hypothetical protein AB7G44_06770 [Bacteroidia bacterium]